jgi:uridine kinase
VIPYACSYKALAASLQRKRHAQSPLLVCIDGPGGSGKSTIARGLAAASDDVQIVQVDDFFRPSADRYAGAVADRPIAAAFDLDRLRAEVLQPLQSGLVANYHVYDWTTDRVSSHTVAVTKPLVVVEGVYSFSTALSEFFDFSVWVECPRDVRLRRGLARDGEAARSRWEDDWMRGEDQYIQSESPRDRVALVCDGSRDDCGRGVIVLREGPNHVNGEVSS